MYRFASATEQFLDFSFLLTYNIIMMMMKRELREESQLRCSPGVGHESRALSTYLCVGYLPKCHIYLSNLSIGPLRILYHGDGR